MLKISYRHPYRNAVGFPSVCQIREYEHAGAVVVVCSELPDNPGTSVTNMAEQIATAIWHDLGQPSLDRFIWIEHYRDQGVVNGQPTVKEHFDLVTFHHDARTGQLDDPHWRRIGRAEAEALIGEAWTSAEPTP